MQAGEYKYKNPSLYMRQRNISRMINTAELLQSHLSLCVYVCTSLVLVSTPH